MTLEVGGVGWGDRRCGESWLPSLVPSGLWDAEASPRAAGFGGIRGSAWLPHIHHVDEWSRVKYHICQEPSALAGVHRFSSRPSSVYLVPTA